MIRDEDIVDIIGPIPAGGGDVTTDNTSDTRIPYKNGSVFDDSPLYLDVANEKVISDWTLEVPGDSVELGETTKLSACSESMIITQELSGESYYASISKFDDTGSTLPCFPNLGGDFSIDIQTTFSTVITTNPLTYSIIGTVVSPNKRQIRKTTLKANGAMTNVRAKFTDNSTGIVLRYVPDKVTWNSGTGGLDLISGDNVFDLISTAADSPGVFNLGVNPFWIDNGQQIDIEIQGDTIDLLGNGSGEPYQTAIVQDGPLSEVALAETADRVQTTGLLEGGVISEDTTTTVDWTAGRGIISDYSDPENPVVTDVSWDAVSAQAVTSVTTDGTTIFGYNASGSIVQKLATALSIEDAHTTIWFGSVTHLSNVIDSVSEAPANIGYDGTGSFSDFINLVIGPANVDGNIYAANGTNLNIDVSGGNAYMLGSNFRTSKAISDIITLPAGAAITFTPVHRTSGAGLSVVYGTPVTAIDPDSYDDGSGTLATVTTDYWTIQRIFRGRSGNTLVAYGQQEFATQALALEALGSESFTEKAPLPFLLYRCALLIQEGATDLSDTAEAEFFAESSFRIGGAQSASATIPGITSPGGSDTAIQYNNAGVFGGDSNFTYDSANRTLCLKSIVSDTALLQFKDSSDAEKMIIQYDENADNVFLAAANGVDVVLSTGSGAFMGIDNQNPASTLHILEISTSTGASAGLTIEQDGVGDAVTQYLLTGGQRWVVGIDNSDGDFFKIASSVDLDSDAVLTLDTKGHAVFSSSVSTLFGGFGSAQNLIKYSQDLANAEWAELGSISVSSNDAIAPDGTLTADTVTWTSSAELKQTLSGMSTLTLYQVSFWGRHVSGGTDIGIELGGGTTVFQTLTSTWKRYNLAVTSGNASLDLEIQSLVASSAEIWGVQVADSIEVISYTRTEADSIDVETTGIVSNGKIFVTGSADFSGKILINDPNAADTQELMTYIAGGTNGGTAKIYVGSRTPEGNVTADGGSIYFRDDGTSSDLYIKRSDSSNTGWFDLIHADSGVKGPASSIQYAIARFDDTTGGSIDDVGQARLVLTASDTALVIGPQLITGNDEIIFTDITDAEVGSIVLDTDTNDLIIESAGRTVFYEDTTETGIEAGITIEQDGTGDAMLQFQLTGGQRWATGIDNTYDKYKIASGNFNNMEALAIDTDYHVALTNSIGTPFGGLGKIQNYLSYSQDFDNSVWQKLSTNPPTVVANNAVAPDGSLTADTVTFPGPGAGLFRQDGLTTSASTAYTITGWVKHVSGGSVLSVDLMDGGGDTISADNVWRRYSLQLTSGVGGSYLDIQRGNAGVYEFWGWQISDGSETTPYAKTLETSLDALEYGSVSNSSARLESREVSTVGIDVVEVWSLDDLPDPVSDVITLPSKFYRFKTSVDFGVNQVKIENFDTVLMDCDDAFINTVSYSGTLPWFIGQGNIRLAGKGITLRLSSDNATMFDIDGGFGADFSTLWADADGCTIGEIRGPFSAVASGLAGVRFFMSRCLITGFKYGAELSNIDYLSVSTSNIFDASDAIGPQISLNGESRFAFFEVLELGLTSATGSFINIDPASIGAVNIRKTILTGDSDFYTPGTTGGISVFADASVSATGITSVSNVSDIARFNFTVGPTLFVGQQVVMSALTNYANGTFYISATGAGYFEIGSAYNGADTGSFLSNSVTVVTGTTPPAELDSVLITGTLEYNIGSVIYNRTGSNFQINAVWDTAETAGTWDTSSLNESSKYVEASGNGEQRNSKQLASVFVSGNTTATGITGTGTYDDLNLVAANVGQGMEEFTLMDAASGEIRYDGINPFEGTLQASISAYKSGGSVVYRFRAFKTVGSGTFDVATVTRGVSTVTGSITLVLSIALNPGDQFRIEVESQAAADDIIIADFSMVVE